MITAFVVSRIAKGNWDVTDNNGASDDGFRNWVEAVDFARGHAVKDGALIIRLSAKDNSVVEVLKPRAAVSARTVKASIETVAPAPTNVQDVIDQVDGETVTAEELATLPTSTLVALYNDAGGNIKGKFKGARKTLIDRIVANS